MLSRLIICMGGRAAEELKFGSEKVTSGRLRLLPRQQVGAGDDHRMGNRASCWDRYCMPKNSEEVFLGKSVTQNKNMSEETARVVDGEIKKTGL